MRGDVRTDRLSNSIDQNETICKDAFLIEDLKKLTEEHEGVCVSIFMPTHRTAAGSQKNQIRFKNLLRSASDTLQNMKNNKAKVHDLLEPAYRLAKRGLFWKHQSDGLALFLSSELFLYYRLPKKFYELVIVTDRFHIKPLLQYLNADQRFYILAISQNEVRLLHCTHYRVSEVDLAGIPKNIYEASKHDTLKKQSRVHGGASGGPGKQKVVLHGPRSGINNTKDHILQYFRQIDMGVRGLLCREHAPLVLAGVDYLFPIYREANTYSNLMEKGILGNPEDVSAEELLAQGVNIVQPYFLEAQMDAADKYRQFADTERASRDIKEIVSAAYYGKIDILFVAVGVQQWGIFDPKSGDVQLHQRKEPGDKDLLDFAAIQTLINSGTVYALIQDMVPDKGPLAALFRC